MNLVMSTGPAEVALADRKSGRRPFTRETLTRNIWEPSMGANLNTGPCVTGRADNYEISWYTISSSGGTQNREYRDVTIVQSPNRARYSWLWCREATGWFGFRHDVGITCLRAGGAAHE